MYYCEVVTTIILIQLKHEETSYWVETSSHIYALKNKSDNILMNYVNCNKITTKLKELRTITRGIRILVCK